MLLLGSSSDIESGGDWHIFCTRWHSRNSASSSCFSIFSIYEFAKQCALMMSTFGPRSGSPLFSSVPSSSSCVQQIFSPHHQHRTAPCLHTATWQGDRLSPISISPSSSPIQIDQQKRQRRRGKGKWWLATVLLGRSIKGWELGKKGWKDWVVMACREQGSGSQGWLGEVQERRGKWMWLQEDWVCSREGEPQEWRLWKHSEGKMIDDNNWQFKEKETQE